MTDNVMKKPLSYEPLKLILANMCLETREKIALRMLSLQKTNNLIPYTLDSAHFSEERIFKVDWKHYEKRFFEYNIYHRLSRYEHEPKERDILSLVLRYIRDGTRIRKLVYDDLPKGLREKNFKIHIAELSLFHDGNTIPHMIVKKFQKLLPMIKDSIPLKKVALDYDDETRPLFGEPLIKTSTELTIRFPTPWNVPIGDLLQNLDNKHIIVELRARERWTDRTSRDLIRNVARHWLNTEKQVGSTFTLPHHDSVFIRNFLLVLVHENQHLSAKLTEISEFGDDFYASCAVIPMNENLEIVVFGTRYGDATRSEGVCNSKFAVKMAVKARGSTSVPGFFK